MTENKIVTGAIYLIGTGEVAVAALAKLLKVYPYQEVHVVASNRSGGLGRLMSKYENIDSDVQFHEIDLHKNMKDLVDLIEDNGMPDITDVILNLGSPHLDMVLMEAALETECHYVDTACYEELDGKGFSYEDQLALAPAFARKGLKAILGGGGSPGITNLLVRLHNSREPVKEAFIFDYNGGSQNKFPFATNFSAEDNLKELDNPMKCLKDGEWQEYPAWSEKHFVQDFLKVSGLQGYEDVDSSAHFYGIYHEEQETLHKTFPHIQTIANYMSFGEDYIKYFNMLKSIGMLGTEPVDDGQGGTIIPIRFLAKMMPHPRDVAPLVKGVAGMKVHTVHDTKQDFPPLETIWDMDHEVCLEDTGTGAVAWSTGVPAVMFMEAMLNTNESGVFVPEDLPGLDADYFRNLASKYGISYRTFQGGSEVSL